MGPPKTGFILPQFVLFLFLMLPTDHALAFVMDRSEADQEIEYVRFRADENLELLNLLSSAPQRDCKWFNFAFVCARTSVGRNQVLEIEARLRGRNRSYVKEWEKLSQTKYQFSAPDKDTLYFSKKQPGYISSLTYEGPQKKLWETLRERPNHGGGLVPPSSHDPAIPLSIAIPTNFAPHATWSVYGDTQWFDAFAEKQAVENGDGVEGFWKSFAKFSATYNCPKDCRGAFEFRHPDKDAALIRQCGVSVVNGVNGAPNECVTMIMYDGGKTYIRTAQTFVGPSLGADGGTDDIDCRPPKGMSEQNVLNQFKTAMESLSKGDVQYRVVVRDGTLIAVNRYTKSGFFDGYENSTIRISSGISSSPPAEPKFVVATSFYLSRTEATSPERYSGVTAAQTKHAIQKLNDLLPVSLNCTIINP